MAQVHADILANAGYPRHAAAVSGAPVVVPPVIINTAPSVPIPDPGTIIGTVAAAGATALTTASTLNPFAPLDTIANLSVAVAKTGNWLSNRRNWVRVAYVGGGVALVLGALLMIVTQRSVSRAESLVGTATRVTRVGRSAKSLVGTRATARAADTKPTAPPPLTPAKPQWWNTPTSDLS